MVSKHSNFLFLRAYTPVVLADLIALFAEDHRASDKVMYAYGTALVGLSLLFVFLDHHIALEENRIGMRVRIACSSLVYRKVNKNLSHRKPQFCFY